MVVPSKIIPPRNVRRGFPNCGEMGEEGRPASVSGGVVGATAFNEKAIYLAYLTRRLDVWSAAFVYELRLKPPGRELRRMIRGRQVTKKTAQTKRNFFEGESSRFRGLDRALEDDKH